MTTPEQHQALQEEYARGEVRLAISREVARHFYLVTPLAEIRRHTARRELWTKSAIYAGVLLGALAALAWGILIVYYHGWWGAIVIPVAGILWTVIAGLLNPVGPWWTISLAFAAGLVLYPLRILPPDVAVPFLFWIASLWINRMTYLAAAHFLVRMVIASQPAFEMLCDHIEVRRAASASG